jgi:predicted nucleic acid-binding protein
MSWLLEDANAADRRYSQAILHLLKRPDVHAVVPVTWGLEVANVLARAEAREILVEAQSDAFLEMLRAAPISVDDATFAQSWTDALHVARRYNLSSYDASYLELALRAGLPLATLDAGLGKAARKAGVKRFTGT